MMKLPVRILNSKKLLQHLLSILPVVLAVAFFCMLFLDQKIAHIFALPWIWDVLWQPSVVLTKAALSEYYFAAAILLWAGSKWIAPRMAYFRGCADQIDFYRKWALNFVAALAVSGIMTYLVKWTVGRERPHRSSDFNPHTFMPFNIHGHWQSFSSGHSQVMFTAATMMSIAFPRAKILWITFAILICSTRIIVLEHFLSDTICGAYVGYAGALIALHLMAKKTKNGLG